MMESCKLVLNLIIKLLSTAQPLFELDYRSNILNTDGISAVRTATEGVILAAELHRSGLETGEVLAFSLKSGLRENVPLFLERNYRRH
jgi:hypothetical protein